MDPMKLFIKNRTKLLRDIKELGLPKILVQNYGFYMSLHPKNYSLVDLELIFRAEEGAKSNTNVRIGLADVVFKNISKPDNLVTKCKKCYSIRNSTGEKVCEMYWI